MKSKLIICLLSCCSLIWAQTTYDVAVSKDEKPGGKITATLVSGHTYSLSATADDGYTFLQWSDGVTSISRTYTHDVADTNPANDAVLYAIFTKNADLHLVNAEVAVSMNSGLPLSATLSVTPGQCKGTLSMFQWYRGEKTTSVNYLVNNGSQYPIMTYGDNQVVEGDKDTQAGGEISATPLECGFTLTATPNNGWSFAYWTDDTEAGAIRDVDYLATTYTAYFKKSAFKVGDQYYDSFADAEAAALLAEVPIELQDGVESIVVSSDIELDGNDQTIGSLTILNDASVNFADKVTITNLYLNSTQGSSAQMFNYVSNLTCTNAYLDVKLEANADVASPDKWYAISAPFDVDVASGIARASGNGTHVSGTDYLVWSYSGDLRKSTGNGWEQVLAGTMKTGRFYMIGIDGTENTWRLTKTSTSAIGGNTQVVLPAYAGSAIDGGWNAVGNTLVQYAKASIADVPLVQVYDNAGSCYVTKFTNATTFVMACPFFAQVAGDNQLELTPYYEKSSSARFMVAKDDEVSSFYEIRLTNEDNEYDAMFVSSSENAKQQYEIGHDLMKLSLVQTRPQIWMVNYGLALSAQEKAPSNEETIFPFNMFVPDNGVYTISASNGLNEVFLLNNGQVVADLTNESYNLNLTKGTKNTYSIKINANRGISTAIEQTSTDDAPNKYLFNNHLFIKQNNRVYDASGVLVR